MFNWFKKQELPELTEADFRQIYKTSDFTELPCGCIYEPAHNQEIRTMRDMEHGPYANSGFLRIGDQVFYPHYRQTDCGRSSEHIKFVEDIKITQAAKEKMQHQLEMEEQSNFDKKVDAKIRMLRASNGEK